MKKLMIPLMLLLLITAASALTPCTTSSCTGKYGNWRSYGTNQIILQNGTAFTWTTDLPRLETFMKGDASTNKLITVLIAFDTFRASIDNQTKPDEFIVYFTSQQDHKHTLLLNSSEVCASEWRSEGICIVAMEIDVWKPETKYNIVQNFAINRFSSSFLKIREETITMSALPFDVTLDIGLYSPDISPDTPDIRDFYLRESVSSMGAQVVMFFSNVATYIRYGLILLYWIVKISLLVFALLMPAYLIMQVYKFIKKEVGT